MVGKYSKEDLENRNDSLEEKERLRGIYEDLVRRGKAGLPLSSIEQAHVYAGVNFLQQDINTFLFVEEARFKQLYLTYFLALDGGGIYLKVRRGEKTQVSRGEAAADLAYLAAEAEKWEAIVTPGGHADPLLQVAAKEARIDRKEMDRVLNIAGNAYLRGTFYYEHKVMQSLLRTRFLYLMAKEILEETDPADCTFNLCVEIIEFTPFSLYHILNRHFAEITKQYTSGKNYHSEEIKPRILAKQIKEILAVIDASGFVQRQHKTELNLRYKGELYQLWAEWKSVLS